MKLEKGQPVTAYLKGQGEFPGVVASVKRTGEIVVEFEDAETVTLDPDLVRLRPGRGRRPSIPTTEDVVPIAAKVPESDHALLREIVESQENPLDPHLPNSTGAEIVAFIRSRAEALGIVATEEAAR